MDLFESTSLIAYVSILFFSGVIPKKIVDQVGSYFPLPHVLMGYHGRWVLKEAATLRPSFGQHVHFTVPVLPGKSLWYCPDR